MDLKASAIEIVKKLVRSGYIAYFAGGWVRDFVMDHPSADIDIATNAPLNKILDLFPGTILVGLAFGVVIVVKNGHQFEVSTFRKDLGYIDGRRPTGIEMTTPEEDALRRDFTINGLFYDPLEGVIHDYVHGLEDIRKKVIKTIGHPDDRFVEDKLRMIRAVRFAARFGFAIDSETEEAIKENAESLFPSVAIERVWQEFNKMAAYPHLDYAMIEMHRLGLLAIIFENLKSLHLNDLKQLVSSFPFFPKQCPTILYILELFQNLSLSSLIEIGKNLKVSNRDLKLIELMHTARQLVSAVEAESVEWAHFYANIESKICLEVIAARYKEDLRKQFLIEHERRQLNLFPHIERIRQNKPLVSAAHLISYGVPKEPIMGVLLKKAERLAINKNFSNPEEVINELKISELFK